MTPRAPISVRQVAPTTTPDGALIAQLVDLFLEARRARLQFLIDLHDLDEDRNFFRSVVLPANQMYLAEAGGAAAGFIAFANGWVNHLYVAPQFQGRGVGTQLLGIAQQANPSLQLWVFEVNEPAIRFYEARGFRLVERTDGAGNEAKRPDVRMRYDARPRDSATL